ncbi:MAG: hypothetical protein AAGG75_12650 [Bacteroidota bacterium]
MYYEFKGKVKMVHQYINEDLRESMYFDPSGKRVRLRSFVEGRMYSDQYCRRMKGIDVTISDTYHINEKLMIKQFVFYKEGRMLKENLFGGSQNLLNQTINEYNAEGSCIRRTKGMGKSQCSYVFTYGNYQNKRSKTKFDNQGKMVKTRRWEYDEYGNKIAYKKFNAQGHLVKYERLFYDSLGQKVRKFCYEVDDLFSSNRPPTHDPNASIFQEVFQHMEVFRFDVNGRPLEVELGLHFFSAMVRYEYDAEGRRIERALSRYRDDFSTRSLTLWEQTTWKYNENGLLLFTSETETHTDWDDYFEMWYTYEFDERGNVLKRMERRGHEDQPWLTETFSYDEASRLKRSELKSEHENISREYDHQGNIIYEKKKGKVLRLEIAYYED